MPIQLNGAGGSTVEAGAFAAKGMHVTAKPHDHGSLGHYAISMQSGAIAAAAGANSAVFVARWTDATRFCLIQRISITGMRATTAFAAGAIDIKAIIGRSWSVAPTVGSHTVATLTGDNQNLRASMGASLFAANQVLMAGTGAITVGTVTNDSQDVGIITTHSSGGVGSATPIIGQIYLPTMDLFYADTASGESPIVLVANEGITVRATVPGTGVWNIGVTMKWAEVTAF